MFDLPPPIDLWLPPKPAIIRPAAVWLANPLGLTREQRRAVADAALKLGLVVPTGFVYSSGGASVSSLTFVDSATAGSSAPSITIPATADVGDFCVILAAHGGTGFSSPAGYTNLGEVGTTVAGQILGKVLASGEPGSAVTVFTSTVTTSRAIALVFGPDAPIVSFSAGATFNGQQTTGDPTAQTITSSGAASYPILALAQYFTTGASIATRTSTPAMTEVAGAATNHYGKYLAYASGAVNHTIDMPDAGNNVLQSGYVVFT